MSSTTRRRSPAHPWDALLAAMAEHLADRSAREAVGVADPRQDRPWNAQMIDTALDARPDTHWIAVLLGPEGAAAEELAARGSEPDSGREVRGLRFEARGSRLERVFDVSDRVIE